MSATIYNAIRDVIESYGGGDAAVRAVCDVVDDEIAAAVRDQMAEYRPEDRLPSPVGLTETEAAARWCPFAREVTPVGKGKKDAAIGNRYLDSDGSDFANPAGCRCIASYCLAWRWFDDLRGYCGLAGKPAFQPMREPRRLPNRTPLKRPTAAEQVDLFDLEAVVSADDSR
jgi:hypothetical protein